LPASDDVVGIVVGGEGISNVLVPDDLGRDSVCPTDTVFLAEVGLATEADIVAVVVGVVIGPAVVVGPGIDGAEVLWASNIDINDEHHGTVEHCADGNPGS
jgi:hypothetical protein